MPVIKTTPLQILSNTGGNLQLQALIHSANNSIDELSKVNTPESTTLQSEYESIITRIQVAINMDNATQLPSGTTVSDLVLEARTQLVTLDRRRDVIISGYVATSKNFFSAIMTEFKYYATAVIYILGPLFGFIIMTNLFFDEKVLYKLFYGFWGALWYPLTILFGIFDPPVWRALFIPLVRSDEPFSFMEFWKYHVTIDIDATAKSTLMMRLICIGLFALFIYCFFIGSSASKTSETFSATPTQVGQFLVLSCSNAVNTINQTSLQSIPDNSYSDKLAGWVQQCTATYSTPPTMPTSNASLLQQVKDACTAGINIVVNDPLVKTNVDSSMLTAMGSGYIDNFCQTLTIG